MKRNSSKKSNKEHRTWEPPCWLSKALVLVLLVVFAVQGMYFALNTKRQIYPDEDYHITLVRKYSETFGLVENASDTYWMGDVETNPYLYHWLGGRLLNLNVFGMDDVLLLRVSSVILGTMTLFIAYLVGKEVLKEKGYAVAVMALLGFVTEFVFLSGSVSYDALVNFLVSVMLLGVLRVLRTHSVWWLGGVVLTLLIGIMTKFTFLPFVPIMLLVILLSQWTYRRSYVEKIQEASKNRPFMFSLYSVAIIVGIVLSVNLYVGNILNYGTIQPGCIDVLTHEQCLNSGLYRRGLELEGGGDSVELVSALAYPVYWARIMLPQIFGISGHKQYLRNVVEFIPLLFVFTFSLGVLLWKMSKILRNKAVLSLFVIGLFYVLVLIYYQNYGSYTRSGNMYLAVQGRYFFPVIIPFLVLLLYSCTQFWKTQIAKVAMMAVVVLFGIYHFEFLFRFLSDSDAIPRFLGDVTEITQLLSFLS